MRSQQLRSFLREYDDGSLTFPEINYRRGAKTSILFGMAQGFVTKPDETLEWGYVRIHTGLDRYNGGEFQGVKDVVMAPFNFESSSFEDQDGVNYGSLTCLNSEINDFQFRIAHMFPKDIKVLDQLKNKYPVRRDTVIGPAGSYGIGEGAHTHTEVMSISGKSNMLEELLHEKYQDVDKEYTEEDIINFYHTQSHFKDADADTIFKDWNALKANRGVTFINKYLYRFKDYSVMKDYTRYSSALLWGGL